MLPVDPVLDLAGKSRIYLLGLGFDVSSWQFDVSDDVTEPPGLATRCIVDGIEISIETTAGAHNPYEVPTFRRDEDSFPVPLETGWQGFMATAGSEATASVLLNCENWAPKDGSGILVTADSPYDVEVTEAVRLKLARVVTGTAQSAADRTGCVTESGDAGKLTAPDAAARTVTADDATGTCKGVTSVATVRETDAGTSPVEVCVLTSSLQLTAQYGPFSPFSDVSEAVVNGEYRSPDNPSGVDRSTAWTSATCQGALGIAYYSLTPVEGSDRRFTSNPLTKSERGDLQRFADQSATRHGCGSPAALP
jgi:hypothetical protein